MKINILQSLSLFLDTQDYSQEEKNEILTLFKKPAIKRVFMLSLYLLIWSLIGIFLDLFFVGGGLFATLMMGDIMLMLFLPALIYFVVNLLAKFLFIKLFLKDQISLGSAALATLPYAGSAILFGATLSNEPLFLDAMKGYFKYQKSKGLIKVCKLCLRDYQKEEATISME